MPLRSATPWRLQHPRPILALYWSAMAVGSHWPRLDLVDSHETDLVFSMDLDKLLHIGAYAGLTLLLVLAQPTRLASARWAALGRAVGIAVVYGMIDEFTQPWFDRSFTWYDLASSAGGIALMTAIIAAWFVWPVAPQRLTASDQRAPAAPPPGAGTVVEE